MADDRLLNDSLLHRSPGFALGAQVARLYPDLALVEVRSHLFQAQNYAKAGHCQLTLRPELHHQRIAAWDPDHGVVRSGHNAWWTVRWNDVSLQIVMVTWEKAMYGEEHHYAVLGPDVAACKAFIEAVCRWAHEVRGEVLVYSDGCFQKDAKLYASIQAADFAQLVLEGSLKRQIREDFTQFLEARELYEQHGIPWKRGALLIGPPGNGKTLCVKALAKQLAIPVFYVRSFEAQHGNPQHSIGEVFARARNTTPCLLVLEDIDSLLTDATRSFFLNELDGFASNTGVVTIATTNHADRLDPAIIERPSRFDRKYHFGLPDAETRREYIALWTSRLQPALRMSDDDCSRLAELTEGFSFAYVQELFVSSMMQWIAERQTGTLMPVATAQLQALREQMSSGVPAVPEEPRPDAAGPRPPWARRPRP